MVSAFVNRAVGTLVFGVKETQGSLEIVDGLEMLTKKDSGLLLHHIGICCLREYIQSKNKMLCLTAISVVQ